MIAVAQKAKAKAVSTEPPVGGWDAQNSLSDMPAKNAVILDNWFPDPDKVVIRPFFSSFATGLGGAVNSLMEYNALDGTNKLFGAANSKIFDVSSSGAVGAAVVSSLSNTKFQHTQMTTSGGHFLFICNGQDTPRTYDGSSWSSTAFGGSITEDNIIWVNNHQRRLWMGEKDSLDAWYLDVNSISGTPTKFPLGGLAKLGGYIMGMGTWTRDSGDGTDDVAVFLTSEGEAILYAGTDPSSASTWALVGVFRVGRPIGRRCMLKAGGDLIMVTEDGYVSAASILSVDRSQYEKTAISRQINKAVNQEVRDHASTYGWQPILYPKGKMLIFNVPQSSTESHQHVFNTLTGAPCRFKGVNAVCWGLKGDKLYFGDSGGTVHFFDDASVSDDNGSAISAEALTAFNYFGSKTQIKSFKMVQPVFQGANTPSVAVDLHIDFQITAPTNVSTPSVTSSNSAKWGVGKWGVGVWGTDNAIFQGWRGIRGIGRSAALRVRVDSKSEAISWVSTDYLYTPGGVL